MAKREWRSRFLAALSVRPHVQAACAAAGVSRHHAYRTRAQSQTFAAQWDEALEAGIDKLEALAFERAEAGDNKLLIFLLRAHRPEKYRDNVHHELAGPDSGPITITYVNDWRSAPVPLEDFGDHSGLRGCATEVTPIAASLRAV